MLDDHHPLDPWGIEKERQREKQGGVGFLAIPFVFPLLAAIVAVLYPLAGAAVLGLATVAVVVASALGMPTEAVGGGLLIPALVLVWLFGRFDIRLARRRFYWWGRHVYRTIVLSCLFLYVAASNADHDGSIGGIAAALVDVPLRLVIAVMLILGTQAALFSTGGGIRAFWHGILEFLRVRPEGFDEWETDDDDAAAEGAMVNRPDAVRPSQEAAASPLFEEGQPAGKPDSGTRTGTFHVGLSTFILAVVVGLPVGTMLALQFTGEAGLGGVMGILVLLLVFGYINGRRLRRVAGSGTPAQRVPRRSPARVLLTCIVAAACVAATLGVLFAWSEADIDLLQAAMRFGGVGAVVGLAIGLVAAWRR